MNDIPVPPFRTLDEAKLFHRLLLVFLHELKVPGEAVQIHHYLLATALDQHSPVSASECASCASPYPCRTVLSVAVGAKFPAPWAPEILFDALVTVGLLRRQGIRDAGAIAWGGDPLFGALRGEDGRWTVFRSERGVETTEQLPGDAAMISHLSEHVRGHPFPFAWGIKPEWTAAVQPGVGQARRWWHEHSQLPYLESDRSDGAPREG